VLTVDLRALQQNYLTVKRQVAPARCGASVKADAYGIGMEPVAKALWAAGCRSFFVALPEEGGKLREILSLADIYVLDGLLPGEAEFYASHRLVPVLNQVAEIEEWVQWCMQAGQKSPAAIQVESGINRLGLQAAEVKELAGSDVLGQFGLALITSHLAKADEPEDVFNKLQLEIFESLRRLVPNTPASLANSPGAFLPKGFHFDLVRPGIALYGGNPFKNKANPFKPVALLKARVLQVKSIGPGESVGYGGDWTAQRGTRIAIIAAGYADGYPRSCSSSSADRERALVWVKGHFAPVVGRVSMDMITVDVTDIPGQIDRGELVELMGAHVTVDDLARWAGTIPYEVLTWLGSRYLRCYSSFDS
jgi:alanine racemase